MCVCVSRLENLIVVVHMVCVCVCVKTGELIAVVTDGMKLTWVLRIIYS